MDNVEEGKELVEKTVRIARVGLGQHGQHQGGVVEQRQEHAALVVTHPQAKDLPALPQLLQPTDVGCPFFSLDDFCSASASCA